jgi:hypothetical protein
VKRPGPPQRWQTAEAGNHDLLARIGQPFGHCDKTIIEKLTLVNADHHGDVVDGPQQLLGARHRRGREGHVGVRDHPGLGVAHIEGRLERLDRKPGDA